MPTREFVKYDDIKFPIQARRSEHGSIELHWHTYFEVELIVSGEPTHIINGQLYESRPGDISLMTPVDFHGFPTNKKFEVKKFIFSADKIPESLSALLTDENNPRILRLGELARSFDEHFDELIEACLDRSELGVLRAQNLAERILIELLASREKRLDSRSELENVPEARLSRALRIIMEHFTERLTLEAVASELHVSANYFSRYFSSALGTSFSHYLKLKRVQYASALLLSSRVSVEEIAYRSGFSSLTFFNRAFREQFNMSPQEYRRRYK